MHWSMQEFGRELGSKRLKNQKNYHNVCLRWHLVFIVFEICPKIVINMLIQLRIEHQILCYSYKKIAQLCRRTVPLDTAFIDSNSAVYRYITCTTTFFNNYSLIIQDFSTKF